jgi:dipeptidyl aminopeptidase/acylaminoacyl peptidase
MVPASNRFSDVVLANFVLGPPMVRRLDGHTVLFVRGLGHDLLPALIRVNLDSQSSQVVRRGKPDNLTWLVNSDGEVAAEENYDQRSGHWSIFIPRDGRMREAASGEEKIDVPLILGLGPTTDTVLLVRNENGDAVWRLLSLKDGSIGPPMAERKILDTAIEDRETHRMIGGIHLTDTYEYIFFDPIMQQSWQAVLRAFHDERVHFESASADFKKVIVRVEGARDGYCFELVDLSTHRAEPLGDVYEGIRAPFEIRRITYAAADGLQIPAYLTLPRGKPLKNLPLVVLPHGGPADRAMADFDWWSQALADQGYAVLKPNYRGSVLTWAYIRRGFGEWGRKMQTDLSDGVRFLAKEGIADPARVCIVGASYGGYAALAGAALDTGVYRCAVSVAGISDIRRMLNWINQRHGNPENRTQRFWDRFMGISGPNDPVAEAISPIRHVDAITVPVLLIHGKDDTVVPFEQSQVIYDALKGAKKDVQLVTLKHEDHWLSRGETRLQMLETSVAFLRAHNPPD